MLMSLNRRLSRSWCLMALCLLLVACGGKSGNSKSTQGSPPPGADDEPIAEEASFNTAQGFTVLREPQPRLPLDEPEREFTDADFAAGLPAVKITVPEGLDQSVNQPPYIDNLANVQVVAGEVLEVIYRPQDPEGDIPGMFPNKLPQGSEFADNFDGTKTFRWQPLQMDVGVLQFTVTAVDPVNSAYRSSHPIMIKVVMPKDPATIPNVAPMLDEVLPHTARAGDPVVFELKGIDLNGTIPTLELPDPPAGASFNPHPRFEEVFVLKFTPAEAGEISVPVLARDSVDTSLSSVQNINLTVLAADAFEVPGSALKTLGAARNVQMGFAALQSFYHRPDGGIYAATAVREYDIVTPENSMKMDYINPEPGRYQFAATDNLIAFAQANGMSVHAHPLVWYRQLPGWIESAALADLETHMREYIQRIMGRYADAVSVWDVINEPLESNGQFRDSNPDTGSIWYQAMGPAYIDKALTLARQLDPESSLLINEFDIGMAGAKFDGLMRLVDDLQAREIPLDGIGFQLHVFSSFDQFDELRANFAAVAERGLDIYITELDVALTEGGTPSQQALVYREIAAACLEQPRCRAIQTWGLTDQYSFRTHFDPLPFDRSYQPKSAYEALQSALEP